MQLADLTFLGELPPWAMVLFVLALAFIIAVGVFGERLGFKRGTAAPVGTGGAQVAAVIVDPAALNRATAAIEAMNMTMIEGNAIENRHSAAVASLATTVKDLKDAVHDLQLEVIRAAAVRGK